MKNILHYQSILIAIIFFSNPSLFAESDHNKKDNVKHPKALQSDIVGDAGAPLVKPSTTNIEAYEHYIQGLNLWNKRLSGELQTREYIFAAIKHFEQAIALDPNYALGYSGLANAYAFSPGYGIPDWKDKRDEALAKALSLDPNIAEAHALLGFNKRNSYDLHGAEKEFQLAIDLKPEYATTHHWYSMMLAWMSRYDEALIAGKRALELDPKSQNYNAALAALFQFAGQDDAAISQYQKTILLHPDRPKLQWSLNTIGVLYIKTERIDEAVDAFSRWSEQNVIDIDEETLRHFCKNVAEYKRTGKPMSLPPELEANPNIGACFLEFIYTGNWSGLNIFNDFKNVPFPSFFLAHLYAIVGQREKAMESIEKLQNKLALSPYILTFLYAMLGEKEITLEFLERAYEMGWMTPLRVKVSPAFDSIRSEPRYITLVREVGLEG